MFIHIYIYIQMIPSFIHTKELKYVYVFACIHIYICIFVYIYTYMCVHIFVTHDPNWHHLYLSMYIYVHRECASDTRSICIYIYVYIYIKTHAHGLFHIFSLTHSLSHTRTYAETYGEVYKQCASGTRSTHIYIHIKTRTHAHAFSHTLSHTHTHANTHTEKYGGVCKQCASGTRSIAIQKSTQCIDCVPGSYTSGPAKAECDSCKLRERAWYIENVFYYPRFYCTVVMCDSCEVFEWCIENVLYCLIFYYTIQYAIISLDLQKLSVKAVSCERERDRERMYSVILYKCVSERKCIL